MKLEIRLPEEGEEFFNVAQRRVTHSGHDFVSHLCVGINGGGEFLTLTHDPQGDHAPSALSVALWERVHERVAHAIDMSEASLAALQAHGFQFKLLPLH